VPINLAYEINVRADAIEKIKLLRLMGYDNPSTRTIYRLRQVISSPDLGLRAGVSDFKFTSEEFLLKLCWVLCIPESDAEQAVKAASEYWFKEAWAFRPRLYADTNLQREDRGLMLMGYLASLGKVSLADGIWRYPIEVQVELASLRVREHMILTGGAMGSAGKIIKYLFTCTENTTIEMSLDGKVIGGIIPAEVITSQ
jgi:hypothetical protein